MASKTVTSSIFLVWCGKSCAYFNFHDYFQPKFTKKNQYRVRCSRVQSKNNIAVLICDWNEVKWNEWRVMSRGWDDNRRALLQYILTCEQEARTSAYKGANGSRSRSIYELTVPTQPVMWMMWCVKADHNTGVYVPYSFRTVVWVLLRPTRTR